MVISSYKVVYTDWGPTKDKHRKEVRKYVEERLGKEQVEKLVAILDKIICPNLLGETRLGKSNYDCEGGRNERDKGV